MSTPNKPGRAWWRPLVDGIDKRVTPPANSLVRTNVFADTVAIMTRMEVRLRRRFERQSTWLMHQYNMATASDMRRIRAQLSALEAQLRDMAERLEDDRIAAAQRDGAPKKPAAAKRAASKTKSG